METHNNYGSKAINLLLETDPEVGRATLAEANRQATTIELIASENFTSPAVLAAMGSILTNKYAEGYPGKRYYGGCANIDVIEQLAIDRAKKLFGAEHANVQPHSGAQANAAAYMALMKPGDTVLAMGLADGGHLSHACTFTSSGIFYHAIPYHVNAEGYIDYDQVRELALEHHPKLIVAGASAYPRIIDWAKFRAIADEVGAYFMVDMAHIAGLVAAKLHPSPVPYADVVTSTSQKTMRGPRGGFILCRKELAPIIDKAVFPKIQGGPLEHIIAGKAVMFGEALKPSFAAYQLQVLSNCQAMAHTFTQNGLHLMTNGSDNHLMLLDLRGTGRTGVEVEKLLEAHNLTVNKNAIPFDPLPASQASGIRIGTPAMTTRGLVEDDAAELAQYISEMILRGEDADYEIIDEGIQHIIARMTPIDKFCL